MISRRNYSWCTNKKAFIRLSCFKIAVINNLHVKKHLKPLGENAFKTCYKVNRILHNCDINEDEANNKLYGLRSSASNQREKVATTTAVSLKESESKLIIEILHLFINSCIITPTKDTKCEWMTYRLVPIVSIYTIMISGFVLWMEPHSETSFKMFFVKVKRQGNPSNGHLESDLVKLGKEIQLGLNKLVKRKVAYPKVAGLLLEGNRATAYKMDLLKFYLTRDNVDDALLTPTILEKLYQLQAIVQKTINNLYQVIQEPGDSANMR
ncbi:hypothetical protein BCV72DRAFT_252630 [Rhizopus microsporus var. microsporus]|uniref:Uncharacterized protein n=1 Tax=Rhizopus microsporus var. microsporus TaxID=86635 RepID=A0A1X0QQZ8_RHIZD|nr:hypothetical protein BCV72DRAFT_252630 [Rhizopus microsporus var. microsporus]